MTKGAAKSSFVSYFIINCDHLFLYLFADYWTPHPSSCSWVPHQFHISVPCHFHHPSLSFPPFHGPLLRILNNANSCGFTSAPPSSLSYSLLCLCPIPALKDDRFQMVLFTQRLVRITLTNVSVSDEGGYFCQLYTDSTHHQVATLSVSVPPETPTVEVKQEAVEGGEAELTCVSPRSKPAATLRWMRKGREIAGTWLTDGLMNSQMIVWVKWGS